jgi:hypothetical protein
MMRSLSTPQKSDLKTLLVFFAFVLIVENVLVIIWACSTEGQETWPSVQAYRIYGVAMLCSAAASFAGGLIGFLFGIPRTDVVIRRESDTAANTDHGWPDAAADGARGGFPPVGHSDQFSNVRRNMRPNTNLEDISDGLTKALLGIGLSQIYRAGDWAREIARILGPSFGPGGTGKIVGLSVLGYGGLAGFFFGYLATRIFLTGAFGRADAWDESNNRRVAEQRTLPRDAQQR